MTGEFIGWILLIALAVVGAVVLYIFFLMKYAVSPRKR